MACWKKYILTVKNKCFPSLNITSLHMDYRAIYLKTALMYPQTYRKTDLNQVPDYI